MNQLATDTVHNVGLYMRYSLKPLTYSRTKLTSGQSDDGITSKRLITSYSFDVKSNWIVLHCYLVIRSVVRTRDASVTKRT